MAEHDLKTDLVNGNAVCRVPGSVSAGELVFLRITVDDAPHHDWGPVKGIDDSFPLEHWAEVADDLDRLGHYPKVLDESKVDGPHLKGDGVAIEFIMPECLRLNLRFRVDFFSATVLRSAVDQDHATASYRTRRPQIVTVKVTGQNPRTDA